MFTVSNNQYNHVPYVTIYLLIILATTKPIIRHKILLNPYKKKYFVTVTRFLLLNQHFFCCVVSWLTCSKFSSLGDFAYGTSSYVENVIFF